MGPSQALAVSRKLYDPRMDDEEDLQLQQALEASLASCHALTSTGVESLPPPLHLQTLQSALLIDDDHN